MICIGNKMDLYKKRMVHANAALEFCGGEMDYFETSAKEGDNVDKAFRNAISKAFMKTTGSREHPSIVHRLTILNRC